MQYNSDTIILYYQAYIKYYTCTHVRVVEIFDVNYMF